jgi:hypothetical protein
VSGSAAPFATPPSGPVNVARHRRASRAARMTSLDSDVEAESRLGSDDGRDPGVAIDLDGGAGALS